MKHHFEGYQNWLENELYLQANDEQLDIKECIVFNAGFYIDFESSNIRNIQHTAKRIKDRIRDRFNQMLKEDGKQTIDPKNQAYWNGKRIYGTKINKFKDTLWDIYGTTYTDKIISFLKDQMYNHDYKRYVHYRDKLVHQGTQP